jgi:hypothetical protein
MLIMKKRIKHKLINQKLCCKFNLLVLQDFKKDIQIPDFLQMPDLMGPLSVLATFLKRQPQQYNGHNYTTLSIGIRVLLDKS